MSKPWYAAPIAAVFLILEVGCSPTDPRDNVRVEEEPAGEHCAHGGVRITDAEGSVQYACNGASGGVAQIESEPAGRNCPEGGLRITAASGSVSYVCSNTTVDEPRQTLCPGATFANAEEGAGIFMEVDGDIRIAGDATAPAAPGHPRVEDALELAAVCHGLEDVPPGGQVNGGIYHRPFTVVMPLDQAAPLLLRAMDQVRPLQVRVRVYALDMDGAQAVSARMDLQNAQLVLLEQFVAPDPAEPLKNRAWLRLAFIYQRYTYSTFGPFGTDVVAEQPLFSPLEPAAPCLPVQGGEQPVLAQLRLAGENVPGSSRDPSRPGAIDVLGVCLRIERGYSGNSPSTVAQYGRLRLVKPQDAATVALQRGLLQAQPAEVTLFTRQENAVTGAVEDAFEQRFEAARIVGYEQFLLEDTRMERIDLTYLRLTQTWLPTASTHQVDLSP